MPLPESQTFIVDSNNVSLNDGLISFETSGVQSSIGDRLVGGSVDINFTHVPDSSSMDVYVLGDLEEFQASQFMLAMQSVGGATLDYAGVLVVDHPTLANGGDIANATITMTVSQEWVNAHGGANAIRIIRYSDGFVERLDTHYVGMDGDLMVFRAFSPHGLSTFALAAGSATAPASAGAMTQPSGPATSLWTYLGALATLAALFGVVAFVVAQQDKKKRKFTR